MTRDPVTAVQYRALERALVDSDDARRYFALAGAFETAGGDSVYGTRDRRAPSASVDDSDGSLPNLLTAAMLSLAVVPHLADADSIPSVPTTENPWTAGGDTARPDVKRGAQLAVRWFDVSPEAVAARAGVPEATLTEADE